jgi:hypothetical protein
MFDSNHLKKGGASRARKRFPHHPLTLPQVIRCQCCLGSVFTAFRPLGSDSLGDRVDRFSFDPSFVSVNEVSGTRPASGQDFDFFFAWPLLRCKVATQSVELVDRSGSVPKRV